MAITPLRRNHRNPVRWIAITLALVLTFAAASSAFPEEGFDGTLEGTYYINGVDRDGVEYSGTLVITTTDDAAVYAMQWILTGAIQTGTGVVTGNDLVIEWKAVEGFDTASFGAGRYAISAEGELNGERTVAGQEGTATEEAFPVK